MGIKTKDKKKSKSKDEDVKKKKKSKDKPEKKAKKKKREVPEVTPISEKFSRTGLIDFIVEQTELDKKAVKAVLGSLENAILGSLVYKKGAGEFTLPGLFKVMTKVKPAQKGGKKMPNRFKPGEFIITKDKPKSVRVKVRPLRKMKEAALPRSKE